MIVRPLPGVRHGQVLDVLRAQVTAATNLRGGGGGDSHHERLASYMEWAAEAAAQLGTVLSSGDVDRLVWTPGYGRLVATLAVADRPGGERLINIMVSRELDERVRAFEATGDAVAKLAGR